MYELRKDENKLKLWYNTLTTGGLCMNIKEKLLKLKEKILSSDLPVSRDFEFNASLEDHPIGEQNI